VVWVDRRRSGGLLRMFFNSHNGLNMTEAINVSPVKFPKAIKIEILSISIKCHILLVQGC
jgi:hypothetical protein